MSNRVKVEDVYDPDVLIMGVAVVLSWTLFLPLRILAWAAKSKKS